MMTSSGAMVGRLILDEWPEDLARLIAATSEVHCDSFPRAAWRASFWASFINAGKSASRTT
jgi:hypothetical protein